MKDYMSGIFINKRKEKEVAEKYVEALATKATVFWTTIPYLFLSSDR